MVSAWLNTPENLEISGRAIDVWRCPLDRPTEPFETLTRCLSEPERQRAKQFRFDDKRSQFVITRARLRHCLAIATGTGASQLEIAADDSGKPFLVENGHLSEIQFNVSHSQSLALIAVTRGQAIGIDVESLEKNVQHLRLAEHYFSDQEKKSLAALANGQVAASFFACWTRKEAVLKAIGTGIAYGLDSFDVATTPETRHCQTELQAEDGSIDRWWIETLPCGQGFAGALAYQTRPVEIRLWI